MDAENAIKTVSMAGFKDHDPSRKGTIPTCFRLRL
jgi:hypothetical protein